jgi:hypothetical protein
VFVHPIVETAMDAGGIDAARELLDDKRYIVLRALVTRCDAVQGLPSCSRRHVVASRGLQQ